MNDNTYINILQERLDWFVQTECYEQAARIRDLITSEITDDEEFKQQHYLNLLKKYAPEFYELIKKEL